MYWKNKNSLFQATLSPLAPVVFSLADFLSLLSSPLTFSFQKPLSLKIIEKNRKMRDCKERRQQPPADLHYHASHLIVACLTRTYLFLLPLLFSPHLHRHHPSCPMNKKDCIFPILLCGLHRQTVKITLKKTNIQIILQNKLVSCIVLL